MAGEDELLSGAKFPLEEYDGPPRAMSCGEEVSGRRASSPSSGEAVALLRRPASPRRPLDGAEEYRIEGARGQRGCE